MGEKIGILVLVRNCGIMKAVWFGMSRLLQGNVSCFCKFSTKFFHLSKLQILKEIWHIAKEYVHFSLLLSRQIINIPFFDIAIAKNWKAQFLACRVKVIRFYQRCAPPPPCPPFLFLLLLLVRVLLLLSLPTSKLITHYWTTSWDLPKSVRTTQLQPGTHRSTSACNLPSPRRTAGPQ